MKGIGINKQLFDRRKELKYSVREACIKLDISKTKLSLIEHGYIRVNDPELREMFIVKYKLEPDFFTKDDFKLYPTPIEKVKKPKKEGGLLSKIFRSLWFKIVCLVLSAGFIALAITGKSMAPRSIDNVDSFYSETINLDWKDAVENQKGAYYPATAFYTSSICLDDVYAIEEVASSPLDPTTSGFWHNSVNFLTNKANLGYTFFFGETVIDTSKIPLFSLLGYDLGSFLCTYEMRVLNGNPRIHFVSYPIYMDDYGELILGDVVSHISVDYLQDSKTFRYNLVEVYDFLSLSLEPVEESSLEFKIFTSMFESQYEEFTLCEALLFSVHKSELRASYEEFYTQLRDGSISYDKFCSSVTSMVILGLVFGIAFFAIFIYSFAKTIIYKLRKEDVNDDSVDSLPIKDESGKSFKELPRDIKFHPVIPEMVIRILVLATALLSSLGLYYIFQALVSIDPMAMIEGMAFKAEIAGFSAVSVMLLFFLKLDIRQGKKNTFLVNYILLFGGLIFYFLLLIIQSTLQNTSSSSAATVAQALNYLPGNIIWGILAFNLLSSFLFDEPKSIQDDDKKRIRYRLLAIIPIAYMVISSVYQIGKAAAGWQWPLAVSTLLFSKALFLTLFSVFYCLIVFFYKRHTEKKFGLENARIYQSGNRYNFIKNLLVVAVIVALGVSDLLIGKFWANNPLGAGGNYVILYIIPFVLLYRPHMGQRNSKWDLAFTVLYGLSLVLGILLIVGSVSTYVVSL